MKTILVIALFVFSAISTLAQTANPNYDEKLAETLGADKYGMKSYVLVILKTGINTTTHKAFIDSCFRSHMDNIGRLVDAGKLIVAGPLGKNENTYKGIFILNVTSFEEATELMKTDGAVSQNILAVELYKWFGSAALPAYIETSDKIWKVKP